jgi:hypothetical protein
MRIALLQSSSRMACCCNTLPRITANRAVCDWSMKKLKSLHAASSSSFKPSGRCRRKTNFHVSGLRFFSIEFRHVDFACRLKAFMRILLRTAFSLIQPWNDNIKSESLKVLCILQFIKQSTKSSFFQKVYLYQSWINIFISCLYKNKFKEMKYKTATGLS